MRLPSPSTEGLAMTEIDTRCRLIFRGCLPTGDPTTRRRVTRRNFTRNIVALLWLEHPLQPTRVASAYPRGHIRLGTVEHPLHGADRKVIRQKSKGLERLFLNFNLYL
jgi:hypothetical protein